MMGKIMTLGDVKALLGKVLGTEKMLEVMREARLDPRDMVETEVDGVPFDPYRNQVWAALREVFPARPATAVLKGVPMGENESPTALVENQLHRWGMITERDVQKDPILTMLFRTAILEGLPPPAKSRLEEMVGLTSKTHREFVDHVIHAMELQLEELKAKEKTKLRKRRK
ncbi:hypothetical protein AAFF_G00276890 [Aldrovandia affinis]|uniref:Uncharacterized protein n=1 Tax=Aldrovandia affinis TaxID=143900 RepID=A0AAD7RAF2_9TELE|nr:hypothetical protein AAFF_G00276890 [Aldrovandia affinis]